MLKYIRYRENYIKFHRGINFYENYDIVDAAGTILGCFTGSFLKGHGRRIDLPKGEVEIAMSGCIDINDKIFNFTRVYTNVKTDTDDLDKKQDIYKYATKLEKELSSTKEEEKNVKLPIFLYYNDETKYEPIKFRFDENDVVTNRTLGYSNCLIVFSKFDASQKYMAFGSFIAWQSYLSNLENKVSNNFKKAIQNINSCIEKIGYKNIKYSIIKNEITLEKNGEEIALSSIKDVDDLIFISIVLDINMRSLILNGSVMDNSFDADGCIVITYKFKKSILLTLTNKINEMFPNCQLIVYNKEP